MRKDQFLKMLLEINSADNKCACLNQGLCQNNKCFCKYPFMGAQCSVQFNKISFFYHKFSKYLIICFFFLGFFLFLGILFYVKQRRRNVAKPVESHERRRNLDSISESEVWKTE